MTDDRMNQDGAPPPHFIVIVPGYMGSLLRDKKTGEIVWVDFESIPLNPLQWQGWVDRLLSRMEYDPDHNQLEPAGIMNEVVFVPPWAKQEHYGRLVNALEKMGYVGDASVPEDKQNLYTFSYDWRQDNRISAQQLGEAIEGWAKNHPPDAQAWLIGHSNGGIVSRWYIEKLGGKERVSKLILMGSPWDGAPKAMKMIFDGLDTLFRRRFDLFHVKERSRKLIRTFPSAYQLIPVQNPFLRNLNNEEVDVFNGQGWLDGDLQLKYLQDAKKFNEDLGTTLSVDTYCFFGRKLPTTTSGVVRVKAGGQWESIEWAALESGDGTVPERSAVHPQARSKLPFVVGHGDIYVDKAVLEFLDWELVGQYEKRSRAGVTGEYLQVQFEPDRDIYAPGEEIRVWATVSTPDGQTPVVDASVTARLIFHSALPGEAGAAPGTDSTDIRLYESDTTPGYYEGRLQAPSQEGYYKIEATVKPVGIPSVRLEELIAVEAVPEPQAGGSS